MENNKEKKDGVHHYTGISLPAAAAVASSRPGLIVAAVVGVCCCGVSSMAEVLSDWGHISKADIADTVQGMGTEDTDRDQT